MKKSSKRIEPENKRSMKEIVIDTGTPRNVLGHVINWNNHKVLFNKWRQ